MSKSLSPSAANSDWGDAAVDGLLGGMVAGLAMLAVLLAAGWLTGSTAAAVLAGFSPAGASIFLTGLLLHLATSAVYGLIYATATRWTRGRLWWAAGPAYGLLLWLLARTILLPLAGTDLSPLPPAVFLAAHLVYGLVLAGWLART